jgi:dCTP deaminase
MSGGLAARVEGRSSFARTGLLVHFTAPTIHTAFEGHITLEIINLGWAPVVLWPNMRICQLIVETVDGDIAMSESQFRGQSKISGTKT